MRCTGLVTISRAWLAGVLLVGPNVVLAQTVLQPQKMPAIGQVDPRFVSYNIEAVRGYGGRFWKPYSAELESRLAESAQKKTSENAPAGMDPSLFSVPAADRSEESAAAKAGCRTWPCPMFESAARG